MTGTPDADCDYVVVGSGAGGGPVAVRLAEGCASRGARLLTGLAFA
jgi:pyruvate/2-oxoglutarate dehydrogenase complex dihydrolipoamide dehydrogenase (E3) component